MITCHKKLLDMLLYIDFVILTSQPVLITGETGVGKEQIARSIHALSKRNGNFIAVNTSGLNGNLVSNALFGYTRRDFFGAEKDKEGLVEKAAGGTLFLDGIEGLNYTSQLKLLHLLEEKAYMPFGQDEMRKTDARVIAATKVDLLALQSTGNLLEDLIAKLQIHHLHIPPLRERMEDVSLLVDHFLEKAAHELNMKKLAPPKGLFNLLKTYSFPGNVNELQAMVFDAVNRRSSGGISLKSFKSWILRAHKDEAKQVILEPDKKRLVTFSDKLPTIKEIAQLLVDEAMERSNGIQTKAAEMIGISRQAMSKRLKKKT